MKKILFISTILIAFSLNTIKAQEKFKVSYGGGINYFIPDDTAFTESNFMYGSFNNSPWFSQEYNLKFSYGNL